jgi:glycosyltransferase involved in cell wall biosynthesis
MSDTATNRRGLNVLAVEPYFGGSHRSFLEAVRTRSEHHWSLLSGSARHWKWRMRSAPLVLAEQCAQWISDGAPGRPPFDVVFCSDMLDLPQWRGFLTASQWLGQPPPPELRDALAQIAGLPTVVYFHENQWTYPTAPRAREDAHYGYTNLLTALAADEVWFNSAFHRRAFLAACQRFIARMPDGRNSHRFEALHRRSRVIPPGFLPVDVVENGEGAVAMRAAKGKTRPLCIGWASRWEHDKRPDRLATVLRAVAAAGVDFELVLLGPRPRESNTALREIETEHAARIRFSGYPRETQEYHRWLAELDLIVSTADHEFFGIAVCEAVSAGAVAVVPNRLSYPEWVPAACRYESLEQAVALICRLSNAELRHRLQKACRVALGPYRFDRVITQIDAAIARLAKNGR